MRGPIVGILLAAGQGSRFGSDKLLHPLPDGTPMAVAAAANLLPACDRVIAVLRPGNEHLADLLGATGCETVLCYASDEGMGHSLAAGVGAAHDAAGWVVALADMPFITTSSHQAVVDGLRAGASLAASEYEGLRGHPVGFDRQWFEQLLNLTGDHGGKPILDAHKQALLLCPVDDPGVLWDVDWPEDLQTSRHGYSKYT
jgi:molybdenum cofactor cytidylyltransferase